MDLSLKIISNAHLINVCKYRQPSCCKYIVFFSEKDNFYCIKNVPELCSRMKQSEATMKATGDNCEGL